MSARLLAALIALAASAPLPAAETAPVPEAPLAETAGGKLEATPGPEASPGAPESAEPPPAEAPQAPDTPPAAAPPAPVPPEPEPPAPAAAKPEREVEGTRLLFLRLNLRIKLVEQELLSMGPDRLLEHMGVASDLLAQLRSRPLEEPEIARADNMEQYLQFLTEQYVQLHGGKAPKKKKGRK